MEAETERTAKAEYALEHSPAEAQQLVLQAAIFRPATERLLRDAGLLPGMRVLDVGCGAGDVAMLAAGIVGPGGAVLGVDRDASILGAARDRAAAAGLRIESRQASVEDGLGLGAFDLAAGRYVLVHQADPAAFARAAASHVRRGGAGQQGFRTMEKSANSGSIQLGRFGTSRARCATLAQSRRKVGRASL